MAFPVGWGRRCEIVLDTSKITGNVSDFPVLITQASLPLEMFDADGTYPAINGGGDVRFSSDILGATQLPCEIGSFVTNNDPALGTAEIWVKSSLATTGTSIYVWYNKAGESQPAANDTYGSQAVWDTNTKAAHHLKDATTSTTNDSTSSANNGTKKAANEPVEYASGKIGRGQDFDGTDDYIAINGLLTSLSTATQGCISFWANLDTDNAAQNLVFTVSKVSGTRTELFIDLDCRAGADRFHCNLKVDGTDQWDFRTDPDSLDAYIGSWVHIALSHNGTEATLYVNGAAQSVTWATTTDKTKWMKAIITDATNKSDTVRLGLIAILGATYVPFNGKVDELHVSSAARSADWIKALYNNQNDPGAFLAEQTPTIPTEITNALDLKIRIKDVATAVLDLKLIIASTFYIRASTDTYGAGDGLSYENAFSGWADVDWTKIPGGTIHDYSLEPYILDDKTFSPTLNIIGHGTFSREATISAGSWVNVSGNIWKAAITANDIDYYSATAPASPSVGEKWFKTKGSGREPYGCAFQWDGTTWNECSYFHKPRLVWVDGVRKFPVVTNGGAITTYNQYYIEDASYARASDDYWIGAELWCKMYPWIFDGQLITSSTAAGRINVPGFHAPSNTLVPPVAYIVGCIAEISANYEWGYDDVEYLYMQFPSDPTTSGVVVSYADGGAPIILRNCSNIKVTGYTFQKLNDAAILSQGSASLEISGNKVTDVYVQDYLQARGVFNILGGDPLESYVGHAYKTGLTIEDNQITNVWNGHGIYTTFFNTADILWNRLTNIGNPTWVSGRNCGFFALWCDYFNVQYNYVDYAQYSGLFGGYVNNSIIDNNICYHTVDGFNDGASIYIVSDPTNTNGTCANNEITNNKIEYLQNSGLCFGIYVDNGASHNLVDGNTFFGIPGGATDGALMENIGAGCTDNDWTNNSIYDADCNIFYQGPSGTNTNNTRISEALYDFSREDLLDLFVEVGLFPTNYLDLALEIIGSLGVHIGGLDAGIIGGISSPSKIGGIE